MAAEPSNPDAGRQLRVARTRLGLSTRQVERLSKVLADEKQNQEYYISHAWLSEMERGIFAPALFKMYTLAAIYQLPFDRVLAFFGLNLGDLAREQVRQPLPRTALIGSANREISFSTVPAGVNWEKTNLVSRMFTGFQGAEAELFPEGEIQSAVYGYVGNRDFTLYPMIRPGSFVQIDATQRRVENGQWPSIFHRPIYFVELRDEYACAWCEARTNALLLVPHPGSGNRIREVKLPSEAEIVGRVTAVTMRLASPRDTESIPTGR
jgi:transcriptional regulator with XRE-family HTH domain